MSEKGTPRHVCVGGVPKTIFNKAILGTHRIDDLFRALFFLHSDSQIKISTSTMI